MPESNSQIVVRADKALIKSFQESCKSQESDASKEIRKYMKTYIAKHGQKQMEL